VVSGVLEVVTCVVTSDGFLEGIMDSLVIITLQVVIEPMLDCSLLDRVLLESVVVCVLTHGAAGGC
jgi:hypothetical protein